MRISVFFNTMFYVRELLCFSTYAIESKFFKIMAEIVAERSVGVQRRTKNSFCNVLAEPKIDCDEFPNPAGKCENVGEDGLRPILIRCFEEYLCWAALR